MAKKPPDSPSIVSDSDSEPEVVIVTGSGSASSDADAAKRPPIPTDAAVLPVRNMVIFPGTVVPLTIGRPKSRALVNDVLPDQKIIIAVCQKHPDVDDPGPGDLYTCGTAIMVLKLLRLEDGNQSIIAHGLARVRITRWLTREPYLRATVRVVEDVVPKSKVTEALVFNARTTASRIIKLSPDIPDEAAVVLNNLDSPSALADFLASNLRIETRLQQELLAETNVAKRLRRINIALEQQVDVLELSEKLQTQVRENIDKSQREYFLNEQLKAIREELGQVDERTIEIEAIRENITAACMSQAAQKEADRELDRIERMPTASPEYHMVRTYLDWMCELPWSTSTAERIDINHAGRILNKDHYGLDKVKRRILEYLAVRKLAPGTHGPILCFVGPPGVGKTSLGQSIARALGRKFIRMSLGGMHDEAELRGHRRTYIGSMPGRIIQELRKAGTNNPVFMLDELDKVGADFRGDPTAALLEVLDPAQNFSFQDHYLNVPFDLSKVMFIATANHMGPVPPALRDRMETLELSGYTQGEKLKIATRYLVPRQLAENGLTEKQLCWREPSIGRIIDSYTNEAGVRGLERQIGAVCRAMAAMVAGGKARKRTVTPKLVTEVLGARQFESEVALRTATPGVATGLAYTPAGGVIIFIEAARFPGRGNMMLTGQLGDVMRESAQAAMSLLKSRLTDKSVSANLSKTDFHIHLPAGATPKDGPSAGVALYAALTSLVTDRPIRPDVAMTGEITLRGLVLPVGGIKEKVLAAGRAGIKTVILPYRNRRDLDELPPEIRKSVSFELARTVDDALEIALVKPKAPKAKKKTRRRAQS